MTPSAVEILDTIAAAADNVEAAKRRLRAEVRIAADTHDVPIAAIARAAGVTRQTIYDWIALGEK